MDQPLLTFDLLQDLWDRLAQLGAPIVREASPGLTESQILTLTEPEGLTLPPEAVTWWRWRNGTPDGVCHGDGFPGREIAPTNELIPLEEALDQRRMILRVAERHSESESGTPSDEVYSPQWVPIIRWSGSRVVADCAVAGPASPLHYVDRHVVAFEEARIPVASSIGSMVQMWIKAMDAGLWHYDPTTKRIKRDWDSMPQTWKDSGFM